MKIGQRIDKLLSGSMGKNQRNVGDWLNYGKELLVIPAIPKSSSSIFGNAIVDIQEYYVDRSVRKYASYMIKNNDSDLRPSIIKEFKHGGVLKYHIPPSGKNLKVLDDLGLRYIILFRHPADVIASIYCNSLNLAQRGQNLRHSIIHPVNHDVVVNSDMDKAINHLIMDGYLYAVLLWMTDWIRYRDKDNSVIVCYEDIINNPRDVFDKVIRFLYNKKIDDIIFKKCADRYANKKIKTDNYPRGWTGKIGVWKDYFSESNKNNFNRVFSSFLLDYKGVLSNYYKLED